MDRHIVPGIEAKHAAEAHRKDLLIQDEYGCRCMTYWVDEERGSAFCLIDAPNEEAVKRMHDRAHGLIPHDIVQVNSNVVEAFLGRITDPVGYYSPDSPNLKIFNDPAFRIVMVAQTKDTRLLKKELGAAKTEKLLLLYHEILREQIAENQGREVELKGERFIASFVSVTQAVLCAARIQKKLHVAGELIDLRIGLNAGMPVTTYKSIFGDVIKMAQYLIHVGAANHTMMASIIREIYKDDGQPSGHETSFISLKPSDENTLELFMDVLEKQYGNPQFAVRDFGNQTAMSKSKLYRKSMALFKSSPNEILRKFRLQKALTLLKKGSTVSHTAFECGFSSPSYFIKCFQESFGLSPLSYQKME
ncbi:nickel-binding protein [Flagellimonas algicola]|nr:nickel-binding protein [Allomuricauda algicola]